MKFDRRISRIFARYMLGAMGVSCFGFNYVSAMEHDNQQAIEKIIEYKKAIAILKWAIAHFVNNFVKDYVSNHPVSGSYDQQIISLYDKITSENFKSQMQNYKSCIIEWIDQNYRGTQTFETGLAKEADIALAKKIWATLSNEEIISLAEQSKEYLKSIYH